MSRIFFLLFFVAIYILSPEHAYAHILKTDGTIGGVVHIQPDDDPVVGQPSEVYVELKDTSGAFNASICDCRVLIRNRTEELYTQVLPILEAAAGTLSSSFTYTFPSTDIYSLTITGKAQNGEFEDFSLSYEFRVDNEPVNELTESSIAQPIERFPYMQFGLLLTILIVFILIVFVKRKRL